MMRLQVLGLNVLGGDEVDTIPAAGQIYDKDTDTVLAVQKGLNAKGFGPLKEDGIWGSKTAAAIKKTTINSTGHIDSQILVWLKIPPPTSIKTRTTVDATQMAVKAALAADDADTAPKVQAAAQQAQAAIAAAQPPPPPEVKAAVDKAAAKAKTASTPAQVQEAKQELQVAAQQAQQAIGGFWGQPLWNGAPINRWQGAATGAGLALAVTGFIMVVRK
jgi:hypothetical protein